MRTDLNKVLSWTLNLEGHAGGLDQRRLSARSELFLQASAYARLEAEAYEEFAASLVLASESPCGGLKDDPVTIELTITARAEDLGAILNLLSLERRDAVRQALAQAGLQFLPRGLNELASLDNVTDESPAVLLQTLIDAILRRDWGRDPSADNRNELLLAASMQRLVFGQANPAAVARDEERRHDHLVLFVNGVANERFFDLYRSSLSRLVTIMEFVESLDIWEEYLRGTSSGDRAPEQLPTLS